MDHDSRAYDTADASSLWQVPSLDRRDAILGGVAAGIADEIGLPALWVRAAFVLLALDGGWGIALYLVAWGLMAWAEMEGLTATQPPIPKAHSQVWRGVGFGCVVVGFLLLFSSLPGLATNFVVGVLVVGAGFALVRRSFTADVAPSQSAAARSNLRTVLLLVSGFGLIALGTMFAVAVEFGVGQTTIVTTIALVLAFAVLAASSPWWWGLFRRIDAERQARVRADERAALGAQLHDSVLQTLALIQNQDDPALSAQLARRQERELRNWLEPDRLSREGTSLKGQLDGLVADVEQLYPIRVETVIVGDALLTPEIDALLAATREAVVNAAKHSNAGEVDVFVEVMEDSVEIFVRDRGTGFEPGGQVERIGIRESIRGRMNRVGGGVTINSELGAGTEVELRVPRIGGM